MLKGKGLQQLGRNGESIGKSKNLCFAQKGGVNNLNNTLFNIHSKTFHLLRAS